MVVSQYPSDLGQLPHSADTPDHVSVEVAEITFDAGAAAQHWWLPSASAYGGGIDALWAQATGVGIRIGVIDTGVNLEHTDLEASGGAEESGTAELTNPHGTRVAGLITGRVDNDIAGMGLAPAAIIAENMIEFGRYTSLDDLVGALQAQGDVDVSNNSWGFTRAFSDAFDDPSGALLFDALSDGVREGRDGLGVNFVFAAGNGRLMLDGENQGGDSNFFNLTNSRMTIAVGASDAQGNGAIFSSPGTNVLLSAPGIGLTTADGLEAGASQSANVAGTSFAAPLVSATIALMLDVNPDLGYRDVQNILLLSANPTASGVENSAVHVNGGGLSFDRDTGFGILDTQAAVALARSWAVQSTARSEIHAELSLGSLGETDEGFAVFAGNHIEAVDAFRLEWVELTLNVSSESLSELRIELMSPSGTSSLIAPNLNAIGTSTELDFTFTSAQFWGEELDGQWLVFFTNAAGAPVAIEDVSIDFYGGAGPRLTHFVTPEIAGRGQGALEIGHVGAEILNVATVSDGVNIDLAQAVGVIAGRVVDWTSAFEVVTAGAGADNLTGSTGNDTFFGGAGRDVLRGAQADDNMRGDAGNDRIAGNDGNDLLRGGSGHDGVFGGTGDDVLAGNMGNDEMRGGNGADRLFGGNGRDDIHGGAGDDLIQGGRGSDFLWGGTGCDTFIWTQATDSTGPIGDVVHDAEGGVDLFDISRLAGTLTWSESFTGVAGQVSYSQSTGLLQVDLTGDHSADVLITFEGAPALTESDFLL